MSNLKIINGIDAVSSYAFIPTGALVTKAYSASSYAQDYTTDDKCINLGIVPCDGRFLNSVAYPVYSDLYSIIGTLYGGTGEAYFQVPDLRTYRRYLSGQGTLTGSIYNPSLSANTSNSISHTHTTASNFTTLSTLTAGNNSHSHTISVNATAASYAGNGGHGGNARYVGGVGNPPGSLSKNDGNSSGSGAAHVHNTDVTGSFGVGDGGTDSHTHSSPAGNASNTADAGAHSHTYSGNFVNNTTTGAEIPYIDIVYFVKI